MGYGLDVLEKDGSKGVPPLCSVTVHSTPLVRRPIMPFNLRHDGYVFEHGTGISEKRFHQV